MSAAAVCSARQLRASLARDTELRAALPFFRYCEQVAEAGDPGQANALLGAPSTTLEAWCQGAKIADSR